MEAHQKPSPAAATTRPPDHTYAADLHTPEQPEPDDLAFRQVLARYGEPAAPEPPAALQQKIIASLPTMPPPQAAAVLRHRRRRRALPGLLGLLVLAGLALLGFWGVFIDSAAVAALFGSTSAGVGQAVLFLILAAKPLLYAVLSLGGLSFILGGMVCIGMAWGWWMLLQLPPQPHISGGVS